MQHHPAGSFGPDRPANGERRPNGGESVPPRIRLGALVVLSAYLLLIGWQSVRPLAVLWVSPANLEPLASIRADLDRGPEAALRTIAAGMLRLAPLAVLLPLVARRLGGGRFASLVHTVAAGAAVSLLIEWSQSLVPSRVADVDSIILNTVGIAVVHQLCYGRLRSLALHEGRPGGRNTLHQEPTPAVPAHPPRAAHPASPPPERAPDRAEQPATDAPTHDTAAHHTTAHDRAAPRVVRSAALSR